MLRVENLYEPQQLICTHVTSTLTRNSLAWPQKCIIHPTTFCKLLLTPAHGHGEYQCLAQPPQKRTVKQLDGTPVGHRTGTQSWFRVSEWHTYVFGVGRNWSAWRKLTQGLKKQSFLKIVDTPTPPLIKHHIKTRTTIFKVCGKWKVCVHT